MGRGDHMVKAGMGPGAHSSHQSICCIKAASKIKAVHRNEISLVFFLHEAATDSAVGK